MVEMRMWLYQEDLRDFHSEQDPQKGSDKAHSVTRGQSCSKLGGGIGPDVGGADDDDVA